MRANNKIKRPAAPQEDLQAICKAIQRNKEHLQSFCNRNNMKFPPITNSPNTNIARLSSLRFRTYLTNEETQSLKKYRSEHLEDEGGRLQWMQRKPSICKITFGRKQEKQKSGVHSGRLTNNRSNDSILRKSQRIKRPYHSQEKPQELSTEVHAHRITTLHHFIQELNLSHTHKDNKALSHSLDPSRNNRYQLLSINRMCTINPQAQLMRTLRGRNVSFDRQVVDTARRHFFNPKDLSRISFYRQTGEFSTPVKKRAVMQKKQGPFFEPWQGNLLEEDMMMEMDK